MQISSVELRVTDEKVPSTWVLPRSLLFRGHTPANVRLATEPLTLRLISSARRPTLRRLYHCRAEAGPDLITTRNHIPPQATFHATWLRFHAADVVAKFLDTYPQHRLDGRLAKIEADRGALTAKLQNRLRRGDFNLGRIGDEHQRENLARKYVESAAALRGFGSELKLLERARELAAEWPELV